ncbi:Oligosaccaryltransferase-domain-containing protein [Rostrohypoxylon terebratum]|nr:Oligosaccaryltransferase-domain-containing protein [Rostrohypoxylon terebratum]
MISDDDLYSLASFLGSLAIVLIILYHFFEVNSREDEVLVTEKAEKGEKNEKSAKSPSASK